ncbi:MAG: glycosyltransferase, partial [Nitrospira sp.]|nr:glycosyltransferase [Nitrospira sp.]
QAIRVSSNGVDTRRFFPIEQCEARRRLGLPEDGKILLSVGRVHLSKGHHILVEALGLLGNSFPGTKLFIIGEIDHESDARQVIKSAIAQYGLEGRVQLVGPQDPNQLRNWYNAADLFCFATEREGSANVLLEAQACGLPCLATPVGGNPDIIDGASVGLLVPGNARSFAEGILAAFSKVWDHHEISIKGKQRTWDTVGQECVGVLNKAVYGGEVLTCVQ